MKEFSIIGTGKVAWHLYQALSDQLNIQIYGRSQGLFPKSIAIQSITELVESDGIILAVSDAAIEQISKQITISSTPVIHCSGATHMNAIHQSEKGVFYPCISFPKHSQVNWKQAPVLTESNSKQSAAVITTLLKALDIQQEVPANSEQRLKLHLAAVFQHNFSIMLSQVAHDILSEAELPSYLLNGTKASVTNALKSYAPFDFITGPAFRKDIGTMQEHEQLLQQSEDLTTLYQLLSKLIQEYQE